MRDSQLHHFLSKRLRELSAKDYELRDAYILKRKREASAFARIALDPDCDEQICSGTKLDWTKGDEEGGGGIKKQDAISPDRSQVSTEFLSRGASRNIIPRYYIYRAPTDF